VETERLLSLRGQLGRRARVLGTLDDMQKKAVETGISLHKGPVGDPEGVSFTAGFERRVKEGCGNGASHSLWDLCVGGTWTEDSSLTGVSAVSGDGTTVNVGAS
jgi:hypothetical protein